MGRWVNKYYIENPIVYILCGNIGTGKSRWAKRMAKENKNTIILSADDFRESINGRYHYSENQKFFLRMVGRKFIDTALTLNYNLIIDETNVTARKRKDLIGLIKYINPNTQIMLVKFSPHGNIHNRMKESRGYTRKKWEGVAKKFLDQWEEPTFSEGFDAIINNDNEESPLTS